MCAINRSNPTHRPLSLALSLSHARPPTLQAAYARGAGAPSAAASRVPRGALLAALESVAASLERAARELEDAAAGAAPGSAAAAAVAVAARGALQAEAAAAQARALASLGVSEADAAAALAAATRPGAGRDEAVAAAAARARRAGGRALLTKSAVLAVMAATFVAQAETMVALVERAVATGECATPAAVKRFISSPAFQAPMKARVAALTADATGLTVEEIDEVTRDPAWMGDPAFQLGVARVSEEGGAVMRQANVRLSELLGELERGGRR